MSPAGEPATPRPGLQLEVAALSLPEELRQRRTAARTAADAVLARAAEDPTGPRDLTAEELAEFTGHVATQREVDDELERRRDEELAELRAASIRRPGPAVPREPVLTREQSVYDWLQARGAFDQAEEGLSFGRYLRGMATGHWDDAPHERALAEATIGAGGALVPSPLAARFIDLVRNRTQVLAAGGRTVPMSSQTEAIPRLTGEGSPAWKSEGAAITAADLTFDRVTLTARTLVRRVDLSVELFEDSDPSAADVIATSFAGQMAVEVDRVALLGTGTPPEPRGVLNQTGVTLTAHGANGTAITNYDFWLDAIGAVRAAGFEPTSHIQAPRSSTSLSKLKEATTNAYMAAPSGLLPMRTTRSIPITVTTGTSTDTSYVFTADWSQLLVGVRTDFTLRFLGERFLADTLSYSFVAYLRADIALEQPAAFVVDTGVRA